MGKWNIKKFASFTRTIHTIDLHTQSSSLKLKSLMKPLYTYSFNAVAEVSVPAMLCVCEDETMQVYATLIAQCVTEFDITVTLATSDGTGMYVYMCTIKFQPNDYLFLQLKMVLTT